MNCLSSVFAKSPRNGEFFRSWLLRWYPVVDRHAAIESLQAAVRKGMSQVGFPQSFFAIVTITKLFEHYGRITPSQAEDDRRAGEKLQLHFCKMLEQNMDT